MRIVAIVALGALGCGSERLHTHAFVASTACGQGPYDVHLPADGTTAKDGLEVVACTPRRIAGHVQVSFGTYEVEDHAFGDVADNQRCVASGGVVTATASGSAAPAAGAPTRALDGGGAVSPGLIEQPYRGSETPFQDALCKELGLTAQQILMPTVMTRTTKDNLINPGTDLHVRIWSDTPNDLAGVVFMVRQITSKDRPSAPEPEPEPARHPTRELAPVPRPDHGAPPAPLGEERPAPPIADATWVPGYWTWTGARWGWIAGFYRDADHAIPAPQVEIPGAPPAIGALWLGGGWQRRGGAWSWINGRWRTR